MKKIAAKKSLAKSVNESCALRFLRHRSFDVDKALALLEADHVCLLLFLYKY